MSHLPARKKRRLSPSDHSSEPSTDPQTNDLSLLATKFASTASKWSLEQDYERRPRKQKRSLESLRLPIKTADGRIEQVSSVTTTKHQEDDLLLNTSESDVNHDSGIEGDEREESSEPVANLSPSALRQLIVEAKEELAKLAALINEDPEEQIGLLRSLSEITHSRNSTVTKLGLATQLAVYKDIIPGYRIRPMSEGEAKERLSKEVKKLRNFEQAIVGNYQRYIKELGRIAGLRRHNPSEDAASLSTVAVSCACNLLTEVPHFNFRAELLKILTDTLSSRENSHDFMLSCTAMQTLFQNDDEGNASLEAVTVMAKMMRARDYRIDERVLNLFLSLRLLTEFSKKGSSTSIDAAEPEAGLSERKRKQKREFWTKKQRKVVKERKSIENEMKEADAIVSHEQRDHMQAETLKIVFGVYFRILKARKPNLMGPVLEGLVKYAHLINQDFFGDLLEALKELIEDANLEFDIDAAHEALWEQQGDSSFSNRDPTRESLLCIIAAFALLQGQDAAAAATSLSLDLSFFVSHLYRILYHVALHAGLESNSSTKILQAQTLSITNSSPSTKVNVQTLIVLLLRSLEAVLLPTNTRSVPPVRLGAFTKQVLTSSLHVTEKSCTAMMGLIVQVLKTHRKKIIALWHTEERRGNGVFDPLHGDVEASNPFATTVWEGELLRWHYAPSVRDGVKTVEAAVADI